MPIPLLNGLAKLRGQGYQVHFKGLEYRIIVPLCYPVGDTIDYLYHLYTQQGWTIEIKTWNICTLWRQWVDRITTPSEYPL